MDAYAGLLGAGSARLRQLYAARIAAAALCKRGDVSAMIAALQSERDAALEQLHVSLVAERALAMCRSQPKTRFRIRAFEPLPSPGRPDRKRRAAYPFRPCPAYSKP